MAFTGRRVVEDRRATAILLERLDLRLIGSTQRFGLFAGGQLDRGIRGRIVLTDAGGLDLGLRQRRLVMVGTAAKGRVDSQHGRRLVRRSGIGGRGQQAAGRSENRCEHGGKLG